MTLPVKSRSDVMVRIDDPGAKTKMKWSLYESISLRRKLLVHRDEQE